MQAMYGFARSFRRSRFTGVSVAMLVALSALVFASTAFAAGAPIVETRPADGINQTEAHLHGNVNPNGAEVTECKFEYGTTTGYGKSVPCSQKTPFGGGNMGVDAQVTGLTAGTTYHYRVSATNKEGTSMGADSAFKTQTPPHKEYVGTGDSLSFGFSQQLFNENFPGEDPHHFEAGYVNDYFGLLQKSVLPLNDVWRLTNTGCPGETTDSYIGNGILAKELKPFGATGEPACAYRNVTGFHLHHEYGGNYNFEGKTTFRSQLESALQVIQEANHDANPDHPVSTVSINIGANDEINGILHHCEKQVKEEFEKEGKSKFGATPEEAVKNCEIAEAPAVFKHILTNLGGILFAIRHGSMFCVNADKTPCDAGHKGVDYKGKIIVQGFYDPFGRVFCVGESFASPGKAPESCTPGPEELESSNLQQLILNFQYRKAFEGFSKEEKEANPFHACFANPQGRFDPSVLGMAEHEPFALQTLTNMDNKTKFMGKPNGPDIHATPLGYGELAKIMDVGFPSVEGPYPAINGGCGT